MNIYDFTVKDAEGNDISLDRFRGKAMLIVNTATGCGFTPQYEGLQRLYDKYNRKGFEILDFPCNQFGRQAPGTEEEIKDFCTVNYNTTFPIFQKINVNGKEAAPLYKWLKKEKKGPLGSSIKWNFTKFLIDRHGDIVARYAPNVTPAEIETAILAIL